MRTTNVMRDLRVSAEGYTPRTEIFEGEPHLVVPVVALVEGVVHAMNAALPEFVAAAEFSKQPAGWNGRPIFEGHPLVNGRAVSGNSPQVLADKKIGTVFNAHAPAGKLAMEAWLHIKRCQRIAPTMLARARAGEPIEISIGTFVDTTDVAGEHNGRAYRGAWKDITPDHLALLPEGTPGACSRTMGCGVRYAQDARMLADDYRVGIGNGNNQYTHAAAAKAHEAAAAAHVRPGTGGRMIDSTPAQAHKLSEAAHAMTVELGNKHASDSSYWAVTSSERGEHYNASEYHLAAADRHNQIAKKQSRNSIGNGNNQYTQVNAAHAAAADAHRAAGDAHARAYEEHSTVVSSLHESRDRAAATSQAAMHLSDTAMEATVAAEALRGTVRAHDLERNRAASRSADRALNHATRAHDLSDHEPGGPTAYEHAAASSHHYEAERLHRGAMSTGLRSAIGNGNNQYTHGNAAAAHDKAAAAHEKAQAANLNARSGGAMQKGRAETASEAADRASLNADNATTKAVGTEAATGQAERASTHSDTALDHAVGARSAAYAGDSNKAASQHEQAMNYHQSAARAHRAAEKQSRNATMNPNENASFFARLMTAARAAFRPAMDADTMSDTDLKRRLLEALQEVEDRVNYVESYHPVTDPTHVVYCVTEPSGPSMTDCEMAMPVEQTWYERPFTLSDAGVVTLGDARVEVEPVMRYEPVEGATPEADEPTALIGNGNNQYTHASAAAAHEKARAAHEKAADSQDTSAHLDLAKKAFSASDNAEHHSQRAEKTAHVAAGRATGAAFKAVRSVQGHDTGDPIEHHREAASQHGEAAHYHRYQAQYEKSRNAAAGAPGSSGDDAPDNNQQEIDMQKSEVLKALEGATDCQLTAIGTILKPRSEAEIRAAVAKEATDADAAAKAQAEAIRVAVEQAVNAAKPKDFAAVLEQAPAEIKAQFKAASDAVAARKTAALKSLEGKNTGFSKEELEAKDGAELEKIARLAGVSSRAAVDYGAQGVNGVGATHETEAPAAPDLGERLRAMRAKK